MKTKYFFLLFCCIAVVTTLSDARSLLPSLLFDMVNQVSIKPFEQGNVNRYPINSVTYEGQENTPASKRFVLPPKNRTSSNKTTNPPITSNLMTASEYQDHCQFCHGNTAETNLSGFASTKMNEVGMTAPALPTLTPYFSDHYLIQKIINGGVIMPSQGHALSDAEKTTIVRYLRSLEK